MGRFLKACKRVAKWFFALPLAILLAGAQTLALLAPYVSPADVWPLALFAIVMPALALANLLLLILFAIRRSWLAFIPLAVLLASIPQFLLLFAFNSKEAQSPHTDDIGIMSYNVNLFQLTPYAQHPPSADSIALLTRRSGASFLCLQEFFSNDSTFSPRDASILFQGNAHLHYVADIPNYHYGIATFSNYPIVAQGYLRFEKSLNSATFSDILIGNDTIRLYNVHLQSYRLSRSSVRFISNPRIASPGRFFSRIRRIVDQLARALRMRGQQVDALANHIAKSPYPVILCGDFNDPPNSYSYRRLRQGLNDAFLEVGRGAGATYRSFRLGYRIDYLLHSPDIEVRSFQIIESKLSDHLPILVHIRLKK